MFSAMSMKNTVFTTNTLSTNTVFFSSFTSPAQNTTNIVNNTTNIVNNYNIIRCGRCSECDDSSCSSGGGGGSGSGNSSVGSEIKLLRFDIWDTFTDVIQTINHLLSEFSMGNFTNVASKLTFDFYNSISKMLLEIKLDPTKNPEYELVRNTISKSFQGLYQSVVMYSELLNGRDEIQRLEAKAVILSDIDLLKDYITTMHLNKRADLFPQANIQVPLLTLKPEYMEYIKLYGFPANAIFDVDKLGEIIVRLNIATDDNVSCSSSSSSSSSSRSELIKKMEVIDNTIQDFSGTTLNLHSTGREIFKYYGVPTHVDASNCSVVAASCADSDSEKDSDSGDSDSLSEYTWD